MDELPMFFDMPAKRIGDCKGAKNVVIKNTGNDKAHFIVVLLCCTVPLPYPGDRFETLF
jgi:hypothetical protein